MKFIDEIKIKVKSGSGGSGACHFRREKFVPFGGPDGGDGGDGGSVIFQLNPSLLTLLDLSYRSFWEAENGKPGSGRNKTGGDGSDLLIEVPAGTEIYDPINGELLAQILPESPRIELLKGGKGGKGNTFFKSATNRTPKHSQPGIQGEERELLIKLKIIANVGLIGLPNAGKSTLISTVSEARPKIADYPFTTLEPCLGVVKVDEGASFVMADIPGLIENAHEGRGLGTKFLKHVERCYVLAHLIECSLFLKDETGEEMLKAFIMINEELTKYSTKLADKKQRLFFSKSDLVPELESREKLKKLFTEFRENLEEPIFFSSATRENISLVKSELYKHIKL
jgi:GTPase